MKPYFTIANLLLFAGIVYFGVSAYGRLASPPPSLPEPGREEKASSASRDTTQRRTPRDYRVVVQRNLFNTRLDAGPPPDISDEAIENLEQTKLNLKLWGTATGLGRDPFAVIEVAKERKQNLYRVGDTVDRATLKRILREKVVLNVDGTDEVLQMEIPEDRRASRSPVSRARRVATQERTTPTTRRAGEQHIALDRSQVAEALENANDVIKQVRIRPHFKNGQPDGLSMTGIRPRSIFRKMGLRNGDIITSVNDEDVQNMTEAIEMFQQLGSADDMEIQIRRRGREQTLKYTLE
jgi:general secretion pathway protein C